METMDAEKIWSNVKDKLVKIIPESSLPWINSFEPTGYSGDVFTVVTDLSMAVSIIRKSHLREIQEILKNVTGRDVYFEIVLDKDIAHSIKKAKLKKRPKTDSNEKNDKPISYLSQMQSSANLNLKYKFENFVVGENSKIAYSVSKAVAQHPAEKYNPLFIYGGSGLGKTHLMQAIGHYALFHLKGIRVKYIKTQDYVNQYINNLRGKDKTDLMIKFRQKFRNIDILLIDDIQFIESKIRCMEELFYTFETLEQLNKQIVITSDRLPKDIPTLPDRLRTRFEMGIVTDIKPPSFETRVQILKKWASDLLLDIEKEVFDYIAGCFDSNVRELEGAFNKVTAVADIENAKITLDFVKDILKEETKQHQVTIENIAKTVAESYNLSIENLKSPARTQNITEARRYTIYLAREMTKMSYEEIAKFLNKKHPTILYSYEKTVEETECNREVKETLRELKQAIKCNNWG